ncbi:MAG: GNAT family N-acetyltransferase, partial [Luteibacter jiangsuensis]
MLLAADDRAGLEAAHVRLLVTARHRVCIYLPQLEGGLLDGEAALAELRRVATSGRQAQIRILTHDAERAHR